MPKKRLYLIDGHSCLLRVYWALRFANVRLSTSKGLPTNAVYGFAVMLNKIIREQKPDYLGLAFDSAVPTFRHEEYKEYKAKRQRTPEDVGPAQMEYVHKLAQALSIRFLEVPGVEADDIIGTLAKRAQAQGMEVIIVTADKDLWQLINQDVRVLADVAKEKFIGPEEAKEYFKVQPEKIPDVKGLAGDTSDNIPGVPKIGGKTAGDLIVQFGSLESVLARVEEVKQEKIRENLKAYADSARLSKRLATIKTDVPLKIDLEELKLKKPNLRVLADLYDELEFTRLKAELGEVPREVEAGPTVLISEPEAVMKKARASGEVAVYSLLVSGEPLQLAWGEDVRGRVLGVGISAQKGEAAYLPVEQVGLLKSLLEDQAVTKIAQEVKSLVILATKMGVTIAGNLVDLSIAGYLLDPGQETFTLEALASRYLNRKALRLRKEDPQGLAQEGSDLALHLANVLLPKLKEDGLESLFYDVEMPLTLVLADMERTGFKLNPDVLARLSKELDRELDSLTGQIHGLAGEEFNINSPKQLQVILFDKLKLTPVTKTKTGYSTDVAVLEKLAAEHPLPRLILDYRAKAKLKSTYVDVLPGLILPETGRIHSSFQQTVTATGRLSSKNPNLQNIPVKTDWGKRIREAFVAEAGKYLLSADYSQIELRVLAHLSGDEVLRDAFKKDQDVHLRTASEIFGVPAQDVTPEMRAVAKTVNFGIIYGLSPFGLSQQLNIEPKVAKEYIDKYFLTYKGVKQFRDKIIQEAREKGYVVTLLGRRRYLPDINSANATVRSLAERMAINTPVQGTAADMIKVAMVNIWKQMSEMKSRMILSVHDELIFEVPTDEIEEMKKVARYCMERAVPLSVPVKVNFSLGKNWG